MRNYDTGATRDSVNNKPQYEGYLSPVVLRRFGQYMLKHQTQADGSIRSADNWQKGIPVPDYMDSLVRHTFDLWFKWRTGRDIDEDLCCAILFNIQGLLLETLQKKESMPKWIAYCDNCGEAMSILDACLCGSKRFTLRAPPVEIKLPPDANNKSE